MAYTPTEWKDRIVEKPRTYNIQNNPDGTVTLIPAPGTVTQVGTPINAANLNKIEQGVAEKVDKPTSAVSGNIAVFDGGAGKIKDSGVSPSAFMVPGNTILAESLEEDSISGTSRLGQKCFIMPNPGRYRITGELMSNTDGNDIIIEIGIPGVGNYIKASAEYRTSSTSYGEFSIDMTLPVSPYGLVSVVGYSDGSGQSGKIRNVRIKGVPGTADVAKVV